MVPSPRMYRSGLKKSCYTLKTERKKKITLALATRFLDLLYGGIVSMGSLGLLAAAQQSCLPSVTGVFCLQRQRAEELWSLSRIPSQ